MSGSMERQARLESMRLVVHGIPRNQGHNSFVFRRHQDFSRECERKVVMYARETRYLMSKIERFQKEVMEKQRELENVDGTMTCQRNSSFNQYSVVGNNNTNNNIYNNNNNSSNSSNNNKHQVEVTPPKLHKEKKDMLLFRVRHRAGEKIYIREPETFPTLPVHYLGPPMRHKPKKLGRNK